MRLILFFLLLFVVPSAGAQPSDIPPCHRTNLPEPAATAGRLADSLRKAGVQTVLTYWRIWGPNGLSGFAKVIWRGPKGLMMAQVGYQAHNDADGGLLPVQYIHLERDIVLSFWFVHRLDTVRTVPRKKEVGVVFGGYGDVHEVQLRTGNEVYCFAIEEDDRTGEPAHLKSRFVSLLTESSRDYFTDVYGRLDTLPVSRLYFRSGPCSGSCPQAWFSLGPGRMLRGGVMRYGKDGAPAPYPATGTFSGWLSREDYAVLQKRAGAVRWARLKTDSAAGSGRPVIDIRITYSGRQYAFRLREPPKKLRRFTDWLRALCERLPLPYANNPKNFEEH